MLALSLRLVGVVEAVELEAETMSVSKVGWVALALLLVGIGALGPGVVEPELGRMLAAAGILVAVGDLLLGLLAWSRIRQDK